MRTFFILYNYFFKNVTNILLKRLSIALNVMYIFFECYDFLILNYTNILLHYNIFKKCHVHSVHGSAIEPFKSSILFGDPDRRIQ